MGFRHEVGEGEVADARGNDGARARVAFGVDFVGRGRELGVVADIFWCRDTGVDFVEHGGHCRHVSCILFVV